MFRDVTAIYVQGRSELLFTTNLSGLFQIDCHSILFLSMAIENQIEWQTKTSIWKSPPLVRVVNKSSDLRFPECYCIIAVTSLCRFQAYSIVVRLDIKPNDIYYL